MGSMSVDKLRPMPACIRTHTHTLSIPGYCSNKMVYPCTICLALCLRLDYIFSRHESMADLTSLALFDRRFCLHTSFSDSALILSTQTLPVSPLPIFRTTCHAMSSKKDKFRPTGQKSKPTSTALCVCVDIDMLPVKSNKCQNTQETFTVYSKRVCLPNFNTTDVEK